MKKYVSRFRLDYVRTLLYMLQQTEYDVSHYRVWLKRVRGFGGVVKRQKLDFTTKIKLLYVGAVVFELLVLVAVVFVMVAWHDILWVPVVGLVALLLLPVVLPYVMVVPLVLGRVLIQKPKEKKILAAAKERLKAHEGYKIAVVGSYGKTSTKEILKTILSAGKKVAATPGNINQPLGISKFIMKLDGDEDVLIFELGEYRYGDIREMCDLVMPDTGFITGVSEAHLENFGSVEAITETLFGLKDYLGDKLLYLNGDNEILADKAGKNDMVYSVNGVSDLLVEDVRVSKFGTDYVVKGYSDDITVSSLLIGRHGIGITVAGIYLARELKIDRDKVLEGLAGIKPFEHRMEPRFIGDAVVIDDTYNGNLEGVKAGLRWLKEIEADRKVYVTPGLVEQGDKTEAIHMEIGELLADGVDKVVLMRNSVTDYLLDGMKSGGFDGEVMVVEEPLRFYENLDKFVASGDVVLMQNDWTDNYA